MRKPPAAFLLGAAVGYLALCFYADIEEDYAYHEYQAKIEAGGAPCYLYLKDHQSAC